MEVSDSGCVREISVMSGSKGEMNIDKLPGNTIVTPAILKEMFFRFSKEMRGTFVGGSNEIKCGLDRIGNGLEGIGNRLDSLGYKMTEGFEQARVERKEVRTTMEQEFQLLNDSIVNANQKFDKRCIEQEELIEKVTDQHLNTSQDNDEELKGHGMNEVEEQVIEITKTENLTNDNCESRDNYESRCDSDVKTINIKQGKRRNKRRNKAMGNLNNIEYRRKHRYDKAKRIKNFRIRIRRMIIKGRKNKVKSQMSKSVKTLYRPKKMTKTKHQKRLRKKVKKLCMNRRHTVPGKCEKSWNMVLRLRSKTFIREEDKRNLEGRYDKRKEEKPWIELISRKVIYL